MVVVTVSAARAWRSWAIVVAAVDAVAGDVADGEQDAAVAGGRGVVPVAADPAGLLGGQVAHRDPQAGQVDRGVRDGQDDLLQLGGELVLGGQAVLVLAQLPLDLGQPGAAGLAGGDVLHDAVDLQRPARRTSRTASMTARRCLIAPLMRIR